MTSLYLWSGVLRGASRANAGHLRGPSGEVRTPTPSGLVVVACVLGALLIVSLSVRGQKKDRDVSGEIDRTLMATYVRLVGEGQFSEAWGTCLSAKYQKAAPLDKFVAAHEKRRKEAGKLEGARLLRFQTSRSLFSKVREHQLLYELSYTGGLQRHYAVVSDADGAFRIEGTYFMTGGETLTFLLW